MKILPDLSPVACGTPGLLQSAVTQRHIEAEVAKCVGGVNSPLIANLFMQYAFDAWMAREFPGSRFERYVDDCVPRTRLEVVM